MIIQIDTREKSRAIKKIVEYFDRHDVRHFESKLYVGDYVNLDNPRLFIDRKQNIREIATNSTTEHSRLKRELEKLHELDARMIFLIEQDKIDGKPITSLEDVMLWQPKKGQGTVSGMRVYRILSAWQQKYPIDFVFCNKRSTGRKIVELLGASK